MRLCCRDGGVFCVGGGAEPDYPVAFFEVVEIARAGCDDGAFCFAAEDLGFRGGVETAAVVSLGCLVIARFAC